MPVHFFFSAKVFPQLELEFIELEKVYRQKDNEFVRLLNTIRNNSITDDDIALFISRCQPSFTAAEDDCLSVRSRALMIWPIAITSNVWRNCPEKSG